jgi:hypothetical protein
MINGLNYFFFGVAMYSSIHIRLWGDIKEYYIIYPLVI